MEAEVRMARLVEAFGKVRRGGLSRVAAAELQGLSERHFRRLYGAYEEDGPEAILDRRRGRPAANKAPERSLTGSRRSTMRAISISAPSISTRRW